MNLYLKQRVFSWGDKFDVRDEYGNVRYYVYGDVFTWGKKLHICDTAGNELYYISQRLFTFLPKYELYRGGENGIYIGEVKKEFTLFLCEYTVDTLGWTVSGDFFDHEYSVTKGGQKIASVSKQWFTWGDTYEISIADARDELDVLAVILTVDATCHSEN